MSATAKVAATLVPLSARLVLAAAMIPLGWQALVESSTGLQGHAVQAVNEPAADWAALIVCATQLIGGALLLVGFLTRIWGLGLTAVCAHVFAATSWGPLTTHGLFHMPAAEFHLAFFYLGLLVLAAILVLTGGGAASLDRLFLRRPQNHTKTITLQATPDSAPLDVSS